MTPYTAIRFWTSTKEESLYGSWRGNHGKVAQVLVEALSVDEEDLKLTGTPPALTAAEVVDVRPPW